MHDVLIIGAGPAGLSAARWCDELGLDTLILEQNEEVGGQLLSVHNPIENYLGVRAANGLSNGSSAGPSNCRYNAVNVCPISTIARANTKTFTACSIANRSGTA